MNPAAPWTLWGKTETLEIKQTPPIRTATQTSQLVKVNYKRPESWRFFLGAYLLTGDPVPAGPLSAVVVARYIVTVGVGRSSFATHPNDIGNNGSATAFGEFRWKIPPGATPGDSNQFGNVKWTTVVSTPPLDDTAPEPVRKDVDVIVSEDIQIQGEAFTLIFPAPTWKCTISMTAYVAPNVHVRPDWFVRMFKGGELGGL